MSRIARLDTAVFRVPTDRPEADGTMRWDSTTLVVVEAVAETGQRGLGFSYCAAAAAGVVHEQLAPAVVACSTDEIRAAWTRMVASVRNIGRQGVAATHARIEQMLFDGAPRPSGGYLRPDPDASGLGIELKRADAEPWRIA